MGHERHQKFGTDQGLNDPVGALLVLYQSCPIFPVALKGGFRYAGVKLILRRAFSGHKVKRVLYRAPRQRRNEQKGF